MDSQEVDQIATRVVEMVNQDRDEHCLFTSDHRRSLHAFAETTTPEAAATLGKISRAIESTSNRLITLAVWSVAILILAFLGSLGYDKLMTLIPQ